MKGYRIIVLSLLVCLVTTCDSDETGLVVSLPGEVDLRTSFYYKIDLTDRSDDTFKVKLYVQGLTADNKIYQFPATVPGVYATYNIGRYVADFRAYDANEQPLPVSHISINQWQLDNPIATRRIEFEIKETFDTSVTENPVHLMAGTSIEDDHVLLNLFDVVGYPTGLKERDFYLKLEYPDGWSVATALPKSQGGLYTADNYDKFVDSPILLGTITSARVKISDAIVAVSAYSEADQLSAGQLLNDVEQVVNDAHAFLKHIPVDRYNFLYFFHDGIDRGALEHNYSSVYVLRDSPYTSGRRDLIKYISAHEFFHIITPLNIHSEIIEDFNFADPTPSQHLWFYEGVTEWASLLMRYRNNSLTTAAILNTFRSKKLQADAYNQTVSLTQVSLTSYTATGQLQYGNIYQKGALVAALLDIRLLELSGGEQGLRELVLQLLEIYNVNQEFSEALFFQELVAMTYPEIEDFINRYIKGTDALPLQAYFAKIGIDFNPATNTFTEMSTKTPQQQLLFDRWRVNL